MRVRAVPPPVTPRLQTAGHRSDHGPVKEPGGFAAELRAGTLSPNLRASYGSRLSSSSGLPATPSRPSRSAGWYRIWDDCLPRFQMVHDETSIGEAILCICGRRPRRRTITIPPSRTGVSQHRTNRRRPLRGICHPELETRRAGRATSSPEIRKTAAKPDTAIDRRGGLSRKIPHPRPAKPIAFREWRPGTLPAPNRIRP